MSSVRQLVVGLWPGLGRAQKPPHTLPIGTYEDVKTTAKSRHLPRRGHSNEIRINNWKK